MAQEWDQDRKKVILSMLDGVVTLHASPGGVLVDLLDYDYDAAPPDKICMCALVDDEPHIHRRLSDEPPLFRQK